MTTLTSEILTELEVLSSAKLVRETESEWALEHLPALIAAARERDELRHQMAFIEVTDEMMADVESNVRAELLATRRALRLAQARAMHNLANTKAADALTGYFVPGRCFRMARLATYWAKKFERMAADCGEEIG